MNDYKKTLWTHTTKLRRLVPRHRRTVLAGVSKLACVLLRVLDVLSLEP